MLKLAIIGAGSTYTPELMEGIIQRKSTLPASCIYMMDIDSRKLETVGALTKRMFAQANYNAEIITTNDIESALQNADFVFAQIRVGLLPARALDEKIPLKHNLIGQETTGIGGFFKAQRTIPVLLDIARRMEKICPDAWLINFTNPSGICAQALSDHTSIKNMGLCNAPINIIKSPSLQFLTEEQLPQAQIEYVGLNHLSFVTSIKHNGIDYLQEAINGNDEYLQKLDGQMGFPKEAIRRIGGVPSYYLKHFVFPRKTLKEQQAAAQTRAEECITIEAELLTVFSDPALCEKPPQLTKRGGAMYSTAACALAESLHTNDGKTHVVNTYNKGAIPFMQPNDTVETHAKIGSSGATPIPITVPVSDYIKALMQSVKAYERLTVQAAITGDRDIAIAALMANPLIQDHDAALACFDELLQAHREYLPQFER